VFWALMVLGFYLGLRLLLFVVSLVLGPFALPAWAPLVVVLGVLVLVARRQGRSR
jgi:hypothetical protein